MNMRYSQFISVTLVLGLLMGFATGSLFAAGTTREKNIVLGNVTELHKGAPAKQQSQIQSSKMGKPIRMPVYKPPKRGAPSGRVGGGSRGDYDTLLAVYALAPEKVRGLTSQDQPDLYWYLSKPTEVPIEFTLIDEDSIDPLIETRLLPPTKTGIQRIQLSNFGVRLSPEKMYRWSVAVVLDPNHRSKDLIASARMQKASPAEIPPTLGQVDAVESTFIHAEAGLWYDAIAMISKAIRESPRQPQFHQMRQALLEQVDLIAVTGLDQMAPKKF